jgi:hypothetical protein
MRSKTLGKIKENACHAPGLMHHEGADQPILLKPSAHNTHVSWARARLALFATAATPSDMARPKRLSCLK